MLTTTFGGLLGGRRGSKPPTLADAALERHHALEQEGAARRSTAEYIMAQMKQAVICSSREEVHDIALARMPPDGLVCEFGVFEGQTISYIAKRMPDRPVFGFDSFEGLPENWRGPFARGVFNTRGRLPPVPPNVSLVKGWFEATLPAFAAGHPGRAAFLHIDCDLYSSTKCIFAHLGGRVLPGTVIVFDEYFDYPGWQEHEFRAFHELVAEADLSYEYLAYNRLHEQVAVLITERRN
jgi:hypothetical protein